MNDLLDLSNPGELHSYTDLPERLGYPASGYNILRPDCQKVNLVPHYSECSLCRLRLTRITYAASGENVLHLLPDSIDVWLLLTTNRDDW